MRNDSFSMKFQLALDKSLKTGEIPIYLRIYVNRLKSEISTRINVSEVSEWDPEIQRIKKPKDPRNATLTTIEGDVTRIYQELKFTKKEISSSIIKDIFLGRDKISLSFLDYANKHFQTRVLVNKDFSPATVRNYQTTIRHLTTYLESIKKTKITLKQIDDEFVRAFDKFLAGLTLDHDPSQALKRNTINKYHCKLKVVLLQAVKDELIPKSPYRDFKIKDEATTRTFLTKPELTLIEEHNLGDNPSLLRVKDIFLFSVYTGLRFADAMNLKEGNIEFDGSRYWILFQQKKTKEHCRLPMLSKAKGICDKYLVERVATGFLLPRITNQKVNAYLKVIAELVGIKKVLTHHIARRTSATIVFLSNGVPLEVVSKQLGHRNIQTTQIYAKITGEMLSNAADRIDHILG